MTDAMQVARERRQQYEDQIAQKQDEIQQLEAMIGDLDNFLAFGQELIGTGDTARVEEQPRIREVTREIPPAIEAALSAAIDDDEDEEADEDDDFAADPADDWEEDDPSASIARVLASRN